MEGEVYVMQCNAADYDAVTQTCASPFYGPAPTTFPTMTITDAQEIGMAMALLLVTAWCIRQCARALQIG